MKTFEEALLTVCRPSCSTTPGEMEADGTSFRDLLEGIANHPETHAMILSIKDLLIGGEINGQSAFLTLFLNGIRVGMEMERQELPAEVIRGL